MSEAGVPLNTSLREFRCAHACQRSPVPVCGVGCLGDVRTWLHVLTRGRRGFFDGLLLLRRGQNVRRKGNFSDLVKKAGYPFKQYIVQTDDGYLLELHRCPCTRAFVCRFACL